MIEMDPLVLPPEAAGEAKAWLRAVHGEDDGAIATLVHGAAELCERFTARVLLARDVRQTLRARPGWLRLGRNPVRSIGAAETIGADGTGSPLAADAYAIDIDANGDGWVRLEAGVAAARIRVTYQAGLAAAWEDLPQALRHGVTRLAAHFYALRTATPGDAPPASVTALWRPYRRLGLR
ncbi:MAG: hypothetical protein QOH04_1783 [Sphingomonadales bacterium]|jgi:uncharacterized phiE125 gp8 family phage protein|nr:hypothetical protein [Sphingomonadales bacterium]